MTGDDAAKARHELASGLLAINEQLEPLFDAADGVRADMERRGYSPTAAEAIALQWLQGAMSLVWKQAG